MSAVTLVHFMHGVCHGPGETRPCNVGYDKVLRGWCLGEFLHDCWPFMSRSMRGQ